jgi:hypothetical protein
MAIESMTEKEAKELSAQGPAKRRSNCRTQWHDPIPQILLATQVHVSGYPVYDRELLHSELLKNAGKVTLIEMQQPMSPFKGQGANQVARCTSFSTSHFK